MNSTCGTKMSGNENMSFSANAYSLQMIEFSYSCSVKKQYSRAEMKALCVRGLN